MSKAAQKKNGIPSPVAKVAIGGSKRRRAKRKHGREAMNPGIIKVSDLTPAQIAKLPAHVREQIGATRSEAKPKRSTAASKSAPRSRPKRKGLQRLAYKAGYQYGTLKQVGRAAKRASKHWRENPKRKRNCSADQLKDWGWTEREIAQARRAGQISRKPSPGPRIPPPHENPHSGWLQAKKRRAAAKRAAATRKKATKKKVARRKPNPAISPAVSGAAVGAVVGRVVDRALDFFDRSEAKLRKLQKKIRVVKKRPERKNPTKKVNRAPRAVANLHRRFQGREVERVANVGASTHVPASVAQLGRLSEIQVAGKRINGFSSKARLVADGKNRLHIVGVRFKKPAEISNPNELALIGPLEKVGYVTAKGHIGGGRTFDFRHTMGEEGGRLPNFYLDAQGFPVIRGGSYRIQRAGIVN